ncbi:hypothetical protein FOVSG1_015242 [Fusarium oxysporum f. sp. vasinfectum]
MQGAIPESLKSPQGLPDERFFSSSIKQASLDGVSHHPVDLSERREYFTGIQARVAEKGVQVAEFPPADLEYLCTLVSGVPGPGLPFYREVNQFAFVSSIQDEDVEGMLDFVIVPIRDDEGGDFNQLTYVWEDWKITIAFKIGGEPRGWGGSYALYCHNDDNVEWKWRYGVHDEDWCSEVYPTVEEFLSFYAHFTEPTEEDLIRSIRMPGRLD